MTAVLPGELDRHHPKLFMCIFNVVHCRRSVNKVCTSTGRNNFLANELFDMVEIPRFGNGVVMGPIWEVFPHFFGLADAVEVLHVRWPAPVSHKHPASDYSLTYGTISSCRPLKNRIGML